MHLVMFDIDGTLVDSAGFDADLYVEAVHRVLGVQIDRHWDAYEHVSDSGILAQVLHEPRFDAGRVELAARVQECFVALVRAYLADQPAAVREIAGAGRLIERLLAAPDVRVAVATGGWEPTARLKLEHVGIDTRRLAMASSSDAMARAEIMRLAAERAMQGAALERATYFGDGPWDRRASAELGYDFIGVGAALRDGVVYPDLGRTDEILARLGVS